ncbi:MAG: hypothetical protein M3O28_14780, partial [Actinomycetota bacterium]|nr:hypothetical protein [Actinomycetota bacterium]
MSARVTGVLVSIVALLLVAPYLAGVTVSAPDPAQRRWWRPRRVAGARMAVTATVGVLLAVPAGYIGGTGA